MRTLSLKLLATLLFLGVAFTSCDNDDDDVISGLEDRNIIIDDTQTFNMKNFIASLEQVKLISEPMSLNLSGYTHLVDDGKALESYFNYKVFGKFGGPLITLTHNFNSSGVVTSTTIENLYQYHSGAKPAKSAKSINITSDPDLYEELTYRFDNKGFITKIMLDNDLDEVLNLEYNTSNQIVKITHDHISTKMLRLPSIFKKEDVVSNSNQSKINAMITTWDEIFEKDSNGNITKYRNTRSDLGDFVKYYFDSNNRNIKLEYYDDDILDDTNIFEYDSTGRLIKFYEEDETNDRNEIKYTNDYMSMLDNNTQNDFLALRNIEDYGEGFKFIKSWVFQYDYETNIFEYCRTSEYTYNDVYKYPLKSKKEYYEGTPENLVLVGYTIIDSRDPANNYRETKESIYNASDTLLYYVEYEVSNSSVQSHQVYMPDGTAINDFNIDNSYMWIELLISYINIT
ncbi:hypothetical protein R3X25_10335 [Lutibacter sp. TH_r2]|uniref:hypothetical protein n=1 Tax=Lutibacter sp. TH_r2 TaxID=3082083 RepID=UPI00295568C3|nr:hypothetical protein [Lutibacter sp. TH_r2]MDV7187679.1 hypothetical protein [Lutibacter sp. TH_r2]